jgi:undecaprenyl diphosphate synthase
VTPGNAILQADVAPASGGGDAPAPQHVAIIMDGNGRWASRRGLPRFEGHRRGVEAMGTKIPRHVAIIMDGNGRWAEARGLPRFAGHSAGVEAVRRTVRASIELGIQFLTIYSFSTENWSRPAAEIAELMGLLRRFIRNDLADLHARNVRVRIIGEKTGVSEDIQRLLVEAETVTRDNSGLTLVIAFNYGSRQEMANAMKAVAEQVAAGALDPASINVKSVERYLMTDGIPEPDLLIRTSGEQRLSNFLLWQLAYAEFVFLPVLWPDFDKVHLAEAINLFHARNRRFGGIGSTP